ncbi:hypothetical protein [Bifidobacterium thermacidophilum]|uniref:Terminase small subunit n=1 Tax=Bifidobacterium thermacidophilum subsp. thermacidophilum TaxID=79262 RepID=A0A087E4E7_9BIFI|nr:hypothetical protein [Bifidobacterium thermacidophilum]KFJ02648.1 hypothetical protein THER5_1111 [Bifidobacterium thermacidophilum subsp. thermacidophilum]
MKCRICGSEFRPTQGGGRPQKYCSAKCRNKAKVMARKGASAKPDSPKPEHDKTEAPKELTSVEFKRMMDDSLEDVLRTNRDVLAHALTDPGTPANALAAISRQLIAVTERLDQLEGGDPLLDLTTDTDESEEMDAAGTGAEII